MFKTKQSEGKTIFAFEGRLDTSTCSKIENDILTQVKGTTQPIVFDLDKIDFVSSSFLRICIFAAKKAGAGNFQIINTLPQINKVFKIAGLDQFMAS